MNSYKKILVAYDGSELSKKAYKEAVALAKGSPDSEVKAVMVISPSKYAATNSYYGMAEDEFEEAALLMKRVCERLREDLPERTTDTAVLQGAPGEEIVRYAIMNSSDLIIMGSRGLGGFKELFLGSVSHSVLQLSNCPVLVIK
ncbi:universal stress protein [Metabacillus sp. GX 13764]|uniref:universal stress protein n=1 Tax=Metabacillus kandeliae TaxID=2900151 RepID=UPI001E47BE54|nr:universal stress protein [Metabacillus kandeliae]MCD7035819.1 universal stress protein [Metabacillus kandeliae]